MCVYVDKWSTRMERIQKLDFLRLSLREYVCDRIFKHFFFLMFSASLSASEIKEKF